MSNSIATSSDWIWDSNYSVYYNPKTQQHAQPQLNGKWIYSEIPTKTTTNDEESEKKVQVKREGDRSLCSYHDIDEGEYDNLDGTAIIEGEEAGDKDRWLKVPQLRLVVISSTVIPSSQTIVLVDPSEPLSFGRDKCHTARVRLKELEVSKSHSVLFWLEEGLEGREGSEGCWGLSDSGSMHGTYLKGNQDGGIGNGKRLSESKTASAPFSLNHLEYVLFSFDLCHSYILTSSYH